MAANSPTTTVTRSEAGATASSLSYVLVTPARNEADYIELTLAAMTMQTVRPLKWVIVSDGSTDATDSIVQRYAERHDWIELIRIPERKERNFGGKVAAFNAGLDRVRSLSFDVIGNVDADISFDPDHFEYLLGQFAANPGLGVAGTAFVEGGSVAYNYAYTNIEHVSGQCQLFRRKCFEQIGGYIPIKGGGIDWTAVTTARMQGWQTRTYEERRFVHHRPMGTGMSGLLLSRFRFGKQDYYLGSHPAWQIFRSAYQMKKKPYVIGGLFLYCGYVWAYVSGIDRPIPQSLVDFRRREQKSNLKRIVLGFLR